jgi:hypothetical protein
VRRTFASSILVASLACGPRGAADPSPPVAPTLEHEPAPPISEPPVDGAATEPNAVEASTSESAAPQPTGWRPPLPPLALVEATDAQKERARQCFDIHRVQAPDVRPDELLAAARCVGELSLPGHEIRLYEHLLATHPAAPETMEATRELGRRLEQVDARAPALEAYEAYLHRYPKQDDARALGQRAVCLARTLQDDARADALLTDLARLYGRRGFARPSTDELPGLCGETSTVTP